jgi:hypothetical protein
VKRPSYQWYPGDVKRDPGLQACSFEARALWREMLDLMHDGKPYGHLTTRGVPIAATDLARLVGISVARVERYLAELESREVFSRKPKGVIYSRRMIRDEKIRRARAAGGAKSLENKNVPQPKERKRRISSRGTLRPSLGGSPSSSVFGLQSSKNPPTPLAGARSGGRGKEPEAIGEIIPSSPPSANDPNWRAFFSGDAPIPAREIA